MSSVTFNENSLDQVNISIAWTEDGAVSEHSYIAWLYEIVDGCDVPSDSGKNSENLKTGGSIV